jgi:hypothetical protein
LQNFRDAFQNIKSRHDAKHGRSELICKQGFYKNSHVLKLQKPHWTNDPMDRVQNESGIFFSIWIEEKMIGKTAHGKTPGEKSALPTRAHYNIHALKLRQLKGYSITSRNFAEAFRKELAAVSRGWPNVSVSYGPLTLMQGWIDCHADSLEPESLALLDRFTKLSPVIDRLLEARSLKPARRPAMSK